MSVSPDSLNHKAKLGTEPQSEAEQASTQLEPKWLRKRLEASTAFCTDLEASTAFCNNRWRSRQAFALLTTKKLNLSSRPSRRLSRRPFRKPSRRPCRRPSREASGKASGKASGTPGKPPGRSPGRSPGRRPGKDLNKNLIRA